VAKIPRRRRDRDSIGAPVLPLILVIVDGLVRLQTQAERDDPPMRR
jgi:hypothetical protein